MSAVNDLREAGLDVRELLEADLAMAQRWLRRHVPVASSVPSLDARAHVVFGFARMVPGLFGPVPEEFLAGAAVIDHSEPTRERVVHGRLVAYHVRRRRPVPPASLALRAVLELAASRGLEAITTTLTIYGMRTAGFTVKTGHRRRADLLHLQRH